MTIQITTNAWSKMKEILLHSKNNMGFIYSVSSGGCNGYNFKLHPIKEKEYNEIIKNKYHTILNNDETNVRVRASGEVEHDGKILSTGGIHEAEFFQKFFAGMNQGLFLDQNLPNNN